MLSELDILRQLHSSERLLRVTKLYASIANLTLATGSTAFVAPIVFAVTHYFTVLLGQILARKIAIPKSNVFSAVILFALAITKIV